VQETTHENLEIKGKVVHLKAKADEKGHYSPALKAKR